jgi:general stress protein YciG
MKEELKAGEKNVSAVHGWRGTEPASNGDKPRGFAALPREKLAEISRKGGVSGHAQGVAHEWTRETAREAGKKGGRATHEKRRELAAVIAPTQD